MSTPSFYNNIKGKVFKSGLSKFCGRQALKNFKGYGLLSRPYILKLLKTVFHKVYWVHSWILCLISSCFLNNWSFLSRVLLSYHQCDAEEGTGDFDKVLFVNLWSNFEGKVLVLVPDTLRQMKGKTLRNKFPIPSFLAPYFLYLHWIQRFTE